MAPESVLGEQDHANKTNFLEVQVSPNPFTDLLKIELHAHTHFDLYNAQG